MFNQRLTPIFLSTVLLLAACKPAVNFFAFHANDSYILPADALPPETKEVFFEADDGVRLQALFLKNPSSDIVIIFFHGNAGNIYHRLDDYQLLRQLGTSVFALSYRGYAKSEGSPSETGINLDGKAAFKYVTKTLGYIPPQVFVFGRSIRSTVAADVAQGKNIAGLILISPLSTGRDQADAMGLGFAASLAGVAFNNETKIKRLKAPLLIIHGNRDTLIPIAMGRKILDAAHGDKTFIEIDGAGHNDISGRFKGYYWPPIAEFIGSEMQN